MLSLLSNMVSSPFRSNILWHLTNLEKLSEAEFVVVFTSYLRALLCKLNMCECCRKYSQSQSR